MFKYKLIWLIVNEIPTLRITKRTESNFTKSRSTGIFTVGYIITRKTWIGVENYRQECTWGWGGGVYTYEGEVSATMDIPQPSHFVDLPVA
jgi:hypothetical protein